MGPQPNLVINGGMKVSQRGTSFTSVSSTQYTLDRWELEFSGSPGAVVDVSQADDVPLGSGLSKSLKIDCTTAEASVGASEAVVLKTTLEAQDLQQLMYGDDATAQPASLSFWIKSPKSGVHCVALYMDDGSVHNIQEFMVTTADAWEWQHVVFPGYATTAIEDDAGAGLTISFPLTAGTDFQASKEVWDSGTDYATSEQQNLLDNTANNFCVTGVKFEAGEAATAFEHPSFGDELMRCMRYYILSPNLGAASPFFRNGIAIGTQNSYHDWFIPTVMRSNPSLGTTGTPGDYRIRHGGSTTNLTNGPVIQEASGAADAGRIGVRGEIATGLTAGETCSLEAVGTAAYLELDSEF